MLQAGGELFEPHAWCRHEGARSATLFRTSMMTQNLEIRAMTQQELGDVAGGGNPEAIISPGDLSMGLWDSDTGAARTVTMFIRRVWRDGALFGR